MIDAQLASAQTCDLIADSKLYLLLLLIPHLISPLFISNELF